MSSFKNSMNYNPKRYAEVNHSNDDQHINNDGLVVYHEYDTDNAKYSDYKPVSGNWCTSTTIAANHNRDHYSRVDDNDKNNNKNANYHVAVGHRNNDECINRNHASLAYHDHDVSNENYSDRKPAARINWGTNTKNVTNHNRDQYSHADDYDKKMNKNPNYHVDVKHRNNDESMKKNHASVAFNDHRVSNEKNSERKPAASNNWGRNTINVRNHNSDKYSLGDDYDKKMNKNPNYLLAVKNRNNDESMNKNHASVAFNDHHVFNESNSDRKPAARNNWGTNTNNATNNNRDHYSRSDDYDTNKNKNPNFHVDVKHRNNDDSMNNNHASVAYNDHRVSNDNNSDRKPAASKNWGRNTNNVMNHNHDQYSLAHDYNTNKNKNPNYHVAVKHHNNHRNNDESMNHNQDSITHHDHHVTNANYSDRKPMSPNEESTTDDENVLDTYDINADEATVELFKKFIKTVKKKS